MKKFIYIMMLFVLTAAVWAQPDPNNPQPDGERGNAQMQQNRMMIQGVMQAMMNNQATTVKSTDGAFFVLRNGVLGKFDPQTLEPLGQYALFGPMPEQPKQDAPAADLQAYLTELTKRLAPATVVVHGTNLVIATNDQFVYIDGTTLQPKINVPLAAQAAAVPAAGGLRLGGMISSGPTLEVNGNIAYLVRGDSMAAFDLDAAKVLADAKIPATMNIDLQQLTGLLRPNQPNAAQPNNRQNRQGQNQDQQNAAKVVVGIIRHVADQGGLWTIEARDGSKYILTGDPAKVLAATPKIDGMNVRVRGTITANAFGGIQYGNGSIAMTSYEIIPN